MKQHPWRRWSVLWRSENQLDGNVERLCGRDGALPLFRTRDECRKFIRAEYGFIRNRPDLRREPHGWKMPIPVRVEIRAVAQ